MSRGNGGPRSDESEISVLGALFLDDDGSVFEKVGALIDEADFAHPAHRAIWRVCVDLRAMGAATDPLAVRAELDSQRLLGDAGGVEYLARIVDIVPTTANAEHHARRVQDAATRRALIDAARRIATRAAEGDGTAAELLDRAEQDVFELGRKAHRGQVALVPMRLLVRDAVEMMDEQAAQRTATGIAALDWMVGGWAPGRLYVLAGRPGMGKSTLAASLALHAALRLGRPVLWYSLEMSAAEMTLQFLAMIAGVDGKKLHHGKANEMSKIEVGYLVDAADLLHKAPIHIADVATVSTSAIRAQARRFVQESGETPAMVVIDYLHLMERGEGDDSNEADRLARTTRAMKVMARELDVPVLLLSQLSRGPEARSDKRPWLADLRSSGGIEQDADVVMFVYRDAYYLSDQRAAERNVEHDAEIIVAKQRSGPTGTVHCYFDPLTARWTGRDQRHGRAVDE